MSQDETLAAHLTKGLICLGTGKYKEALIHFKNALDTQEKNPEKNHPATAITYNNIGAVYEKLGEYTTALAYYQKALAIQEKNQRKDHPDTATTYNNIGGVYRDLGKYTTALDFYQKALAIQEKNPGKNHPDTAITYNNIGLSHHNLGEYTTALDFYQKALAILKETLEKDHPHTAITYNNIGTVYEKLGEHTTALDFYQKALDIREKTLRKDHPDTARTYNNIGAVYEKLGEYTTALDFYQKALDCFSTNYTFITLQENNLQDDIAMFMTLPKHLAKIIINLLEKQEKQDKADCDKVRTIAIHIIKILTAKTITKNTDEKIVHYTSWPHAVSMLTERENDVSQLKNTINMRAYHSNYANDPDEGKWILDILDIGAPHDPDTRILPFCLSFVSTEHPDNLSFWQTYGDNAKGVALVTTTQELSPQTPSATKGVALVNTTQALSQRTLPTSTMLCKVGYVSKEDLQEPSNSTIEDLKEPSNSTIYLKSIKTTYKELKEDKQKTAAANLIARFLGHVFKSDFYKHEKEIRLLHYIRSGDGRIKDDDGNKLYIDADINKVNEIVIGPENDQRPSIFLHHLKDKSENKVSLLKNIAISASTIRYRNTKQ